MQITSLESKVLITDDVEETLQRMVKDIAPTHIFILTDEHTHQHCYPLIQGVDVLQKAQIIEIPSGEDNKTIDTTVKVWNYLSNNGADRKSLLINLGGGVIGDLGGFAASTFKRGIPFINIPTTLLAQVDASIGGKLAINLGGLKNEVGVFQTPRYVWVSSIFLKTLDKENLMSGYAEMVKHALIYSEEQWQKLHEFDPSEQEIDYARFNSLITKSLLIKNDFVQADPREHGIRKALNFGHTFGHAFESWALYRKQGLMHGHAVALGMICALYLSHKKLKFAEEKMNEIIQYILKHYQKMDLAKEWYDEIYALMLHDKKNDGGNINFTLLSKIGAVEYNKPCSYEEIVETLDFYNSVSQLVS